MKHQQRTISYIPYSFCPNHTSTIEALARSKLSGREFRIVLLILRQTDGYLRNEDQLSPTFISAKTGISKLNISHATARLKELGIIIITPGKIKTYSVNPPHLWSEKAFVKSDNSFVKSDERHSSNLTRTLAENDENQIPTKDNLKRTKIKKTSYSYITGKFGHLVRH